MRSVRTTVAILMANALALGGATVVLAGPAPSSNPIVCNVNDDATQDLAFAGATTNRVNVILNGASTSTAFFANGGGAWTLQTCQKVGSAGLISQGASGVAANFVRVQTLNSTGTAVAGTTFVGRGGGAWNLVGSADVDGDGLQDLIFDGVDATPAAPFGRVSFVAGTNAGTHLFIGLAGGFWGFIGKGDVDADNDEDIFYVSNDGAILRIDISNGTTTPTSAFLPLAGGAFAVMAIGDVTGDKKADLLLNSAGTAKITQLDGGTALGSIFRPNGGGTLVPRFIADADGNTAGDLIFVGATQSRVDFMSNTGLAFSNSAFIANGSGTPSLVGDFDGDGNDDIVTESGTAVQFLHLDSTGIKSTSAGLANGGGSLTLVE